MAGADVIGTAICIGLLVIVAYVVAGSIITTTGVVTTAQNGIDTQNAARLNTAIQISNVSFYGPYTLSDFPWSSHYILYFTITNTGTETIRNFNSTDVFVTIAGSAPVRYKFAANAYKYADYDGGHFGGCGDANTGTWNFGPRVDVLPDPPPTPILEPGKLMIIRIIGFVTKPDHYQVGVVTSNGVSAVDTV